MCALLSFGVGTTTSVVTFLAKSGSGMYDYHPGTTYSMGGQCYRLRVVSILGKWRTGEQDTRVSESRTRARLGGHAENSALLSFYNTANFLLFKMSL